MLQKSADTRKKLPPLKPMLALPTWGQKWFVSVADAFEIPDFDLGHPVAIGGYPYTGKIEKWDPESKTWSISSDLALSEAKAGFGALSVPTHLVCP